MDDFLNSPGNLHDPQQLSLFLSSCADLANEAHFICASIPNTDLPHAEAICRKLHVVRNILLRIDASILTSRARDGLLTSLESTIAFIDSHLEDPERWSRPPVPEPEHLGNRGRPRLLIDVKRAVRLYEMGGKWTHIARLMGTNRETLRERVMELPLEDRPQNAPTYITDDDLDQWVKYIHDEHPFTGATIVRGHLNDLGIKIGRRRVQLSLKRVDELGVLERYGKYIRRRVYNVKDAGALYHMDGNEKLKPWGFLVQGCIDGASRRVIYAEVTNNKRASTVARIFRAAVRSMGSWPTRVRGDFGTENNEVERMMFARWAGIHSLPFLRGKSQANVRIERFWRDLRKDSLELFRVIFLHLEHCGWFDIERLSHRACLFLTFRARIQANIDASVRAWNNHALSTEGNRSPLLIYEMSKFEQERAGTWPGQDDNVDEWYGLDGEENLPPAENGEEPMAPRAEPPEAGMRRAGIYVCSDEELAWVKQEMGDFNFERECENWGVDVYREAVERLHELHPDVDNNT